ncbi:hypothetical protein AAG570_006284 [Ranatra chinensis]|uniref:Nudix hydrolase domain-containing protein n=1 Tax=Ranatra chinensis TaxID=642074 RepID=A0ABD0ZES7_9HEMI
MKQFSSSCLRTFPIGSEQVLNDFPSILNIISGGSKEECIKRFKSISISPRKKSSGEEMKQAAVLVPLCVVNKELSLLYTLRTADLKRHRGQVSFPGGMMDPTDISLEETALRETEEELGINRNSVELWGSGSIVVGLELSVLPVLGYLGSMNLETLKPNPDEVEQVFAISLKHFCDSNNCKFTQFRVGSDKGYVLPAYINAKYRVWGITALITHIVLCSLLPNHYLHKLEYIKPIVLTDPVLCKVYF